MSLIKILKKYFRFIIKKSFVTYYKVYNNTFLKKNIYILSHNLFVLYSLLHYKEVKNSFL